MALNLRVIPKAEFVQDDDLDECDICQAGVLTDDMLLFCDGCNVAVHPNCYCVETIPEGPWFCQKCQDTGHEEIRCCLCPSKDGAMTRTQDGKWYHV